MLTKLIHLAARWRAMFRPTALDEELQQELRTHTRLLADDYLQSGMSEQEAMRRARLTVGGETQIREAHREVRSLPLLETTLRDLRYAFRTLRRDAGFTTFAVLIAALGIGASTTVFNTVNALLLRPLPVRDPASLVWIKAATKNPEGDLSSETLKVNPFVEYRNQNQSFEGLAAYFAFYEAGNQRLTGEGESERLTGLLVSQNFFPLLGVNPKLGRTFSHEECQESRPVAILSERLWTRRFAADPYIAGRKLNLNGRVFTVIGVTPFDFGSVFAPGTGVDLYFPLPLTEAMNRGGNTLSVVGRLRPGFTLPQAQAEADVLTGPIGARHERDGLRVTMTPLEDRVRGRLRPALYLLAAAIGVVMLIVCANLSNLQLARAAARQKEMAIRLALGAERGRLIRQMVTESLLLSAGGALVALLFAAPLTNLLASLQSVNLPLRESIRFDPWAFAFAAAMAIALGVILGLAPLAQAGRLAISDGLRESGRGSSAGGGRVWIRSALVVSEIALACILLVGGGLLTRSFFRVLDADLGFQPSHVAAIRIDRPVDNRVAYLNEVLRQAREVPGVTVAALTDVLPLAGNRSWGAGAKGRSYSRTNPPPDAFVRIVTDGYLTAMGIPLRAGRDLDERDKTGSKPVIVINETLARLLWPGEDPLGKTLLYTDVDREVVGVVSNVRHLALEKESGPEMYLPMRQTNDFSAVYLLIRSSLPPSGLAPALRDSLGRLQPGMRSSEFITLQQLVDRSVSPRKFLVVLVAGFSAFALVLAALGVYAVIAQAVNQQKQEIGIRMAMGASASDIQRQILKRTLRLAGLGLVIGTAIAALLTNSLKALLYGVTGADPVTYIAMTSVLTLTSIAAGYIPARRASRTDPIEALRIG
jgi:predicted permease